MGSSKSYKLNQNVHSKQVADKSPEKPKQPKFKRKTAPFYKLFRFMDSVDKFIIFLMIICSMILGLAFPVNIWIFQKVVNILVIPQRNSTAFSYGKEMNDLIIQFAILSSIAFASGFTQMICISLTASRQSRRYKSNYFSALLRQDISWFDKQQTGQIITRITDDVESVEVAISDKLAQFIQQITLFIGSLIIAAVSGWKLTLVGCGSVPLMCIAFGVMIHFIKTYTIAQIRAYSVAGGIAEEILSNVRTVVSFNAQQKEVDRYSTNLRTAENFGVKKSICMGVGSGCVGFFVFGFAGIVFYVGLLFVMDNSGENYTPGVVIQVFLTIVLGSISLGTALPIIENFMTAKVAAYNIFEVIDRVPIIDIKKPGFIPNIFHQDITFRNVNFVYPARPDIPILQDFNFTIPFGKTIAFIGPSGSGKSTIIHLLQRFYDPVDGEITLGDFNLKDLDLNWYRSHIGVVQQEPPLFSGTIKENVQLGKITSTEDEVIKSTKISNSYDFIMKTKDSFDTLMGDRGTGFSGGQKQRIAIAMALVRDPKLLLLDEATSALDNQSEKLVQAALEKTIAEGSRTIIMVAHRLQTVRNADIIVVMKNGKIEEQGNHSELILKKGLYWEMLQLQKTEEVKEEEEKEDKEIETIAENKVLEEYSSFRKISSQISVDFSKNKEKKQRFQALRDFGRLLSINKHEKYYLILGFISSIFVGIIFPCASLIYAQMFQVFNEKDDTKKRETGAVFSALFLLPAGILLIMQIIKNFSLGKAGEVLTTKLRRKMMSSMLKQEMAWFDDLENLPGILTARLALEVSLVKGAAGIQLSVFIEAASNVLAAIIIGFYFSWQLSLLFLIFIPFITITGIIQGKLSSNQRVTKTSSVSSSALVMEVLNNIRTVHSLGLQEHFSSKFNENLKSSSSKGEIIIYGIISGIGASSLFYAYCVIFYVGAILIDKGFIVMIQLIRVFACFTMSASALGRAIAAASDTEKARNAARKTLSTIDRISLIDANSGIIPSSNLSGKIEFNDIYFRYPTRLNVSVLKHLSLSINVGESVALVGHSGCGKSTLLQLVERYYDPINSPVHGYGKVLLDDYDLKTLNLSWVRNQIGIVKQEPSLFNMTILENIIYGLQEAGNMDRVVAVAKMSNIHDFIESLPEKYKTKVGQRGGHLSGGQKQRICIARALYKNPSILLLDEATSALDTQSEIVVQEALEKAQANSTNLIIAHRLSTIKNSDKIAVIENGKVIESGTNDALLNLKGKYYDLSMSHVN